jgi:prepilin-type N-terminal cleavage/methylation domain-containing protein
MNEWAGSLGSETALKTSFREHSHGDSRIQPRETSRRKMRGFTLVELLAVLIIVAILAGIGTPIYLGYVRGARSADAQTTISAIVTANKVYYQKYEKYTSDVAELEKRRLITMDEGTQSKWNFEIGAAGKDFTTVQATSSEDMEGGAGKVVTFNVKEGKFSGYGTDEDIED